MECDMLLRLIGLINLILYLIKLINIQGRESNLGDLVEIEYPNKNNPSNIR